MECLQASWMYRAALTSYDDPSLAQDYFEHMQACYRLPFVLCCVYHPFDLTLPRSDDMCFSDRVLNFTHVRASSGSLFT